MHRAGLWGDTLHSEQGGEHRAALRSPFPIQGRDPTCAMGKGPWAILLGLSEAGGRSSGPDNTPGVPVWGSQGKMRSQVRGHPLLIDKCLQPETLSGGGHAAPWMGCPGERGLPSRPRRA